MDFNEDYSPVLAAIDVVRRDIGLNCEELWFWAPGQLDPAWLDGDELEQLYEALCRHAVDDRGLALDSLAA